jgi:hypothetical protein
MVALHPNGHFRNQLSGVQGGGCWRRRADTIDTADGEQGRHGIARSAAVFRAVPCEFLQLYALVSALTRAKNFVYLSEETGLVPLGFNWLLSNPAS